jgi:hypothetical protein
LPQNKGRINLSKVGTLGLLCLVFLLTLPAPGFALDLGISPPDISIKIDRGATYTGEIFVFGSDDETVNVNVYKSDWLLTSSGNYQFLPMGTIKRSASPWITLNINKLSLPPKAGQKIAYSLKVPSNASGSYWAAIMFSTIPEAVQGKKQIQIAVSGRVAYIMRIDINGSPSGIGNIDRFNLRWDKENKKVMSVMRIKNNHDSFVRFRGRLELRDSQGKLVAVLPFSEGLVLPESSREFDLQDYRLEFKPGFYVALAIADLGDKSMKAVQTSFEIK